MAEDDQYGLTFIFGVVGAVVLGAEHEWRNRKRS